MEEITQKQIKDLREKYETYAKENGIHLNPNNELVNNLLKAMLLREKKDGEKYCPCRRVTGDSKKDKEIICPCIFHLDEIKSQGHCHCLLFVK